MIQTQTTVTTEAMIVENVNFTITTFEQKTMGFCDTCGTQETGTVGGLQADGWYLGRNEHFCPSCNQ